MSGGASRNADSRVLRAVLRNVGVRSGRLEDAGPKQRETAAARRRRRVARKIEAAR